MNREDVRMSLRLDTIAKELRKNSKSKATLKEYQAFYMSPNVDADGKMKNMVGGVAVYSRVEFTGTHGVGKIELI